MSENLTITQEPDPISDKGVRTIVALAVRRPSATLEPEEFRALKNLLKKGFGIEASREYNSGDRLI